MASESRRQSEQEVAFHLSSPSLCQQCKALTFTYAPSLDFDYQRHDSLRRFPLLERSDGSGCEFCGFLRSCLQIMTRRNSSSHTLLSSSDVIAKNVTLDGKGHGLSKWPLSYLIVTVQTDWGLPKEIRIEWQSHELLPELLGQSPLSNGNVELVMAWLHECNTSHQICNLNRERFSPTRLIDARLSDFLRIEVCQGQAFKYAALSYCWGKQEIDARTTTTNLASRSIGFPATNLPQTLQDAIHVVRRLGIPYIWIDMLCIIQDDTSDWQKEAGQMASIYQNAYLTIAATVADSSSDGFLKRQSCSLEIPITKNQAFDNQTAVIHARFPADSSTSALIANSTWSRRGWTFQEHILSTRVLFFTDEILYFECITTQKVEDSRYGVPDAVFVPWLQDKNYEKLAQKQWPSMKNDTSINTRKGNDSYLNWYSIVGEYTKRELSYATDKLPALSGLAHKFAQAIDDTYIDGLWRGDLWQGLLWRPDFRVDMKRPSKYRAPSWSWAALDGAVVWRSKDLLSGQTSGIQVVEALPCKVDAVGHITRGRIVVSGKLLPVIEIMQNPTSWQPGAYRDKHGSEAEADLLAGFFLNSGIVAFRVGYNITNCCGLLLQPIEDSHGSKKYCRIGFFRCQSSKISRVFSEIESCVITII